MGRAVRVIEVSGFWHLLAIELLIDRSGYELVLSEDDKFDDLIVDVASGAIAFEGLVVWFKERLVR